MSAVTDSLYTALLVGVMAGITHGDPYSRPFSFPLPGYLVFLIDPTGRTLSWCYVIQVMVSQIAIISCCVTNVQDIATSIEWYNDLWAASFQRKRLTEPL